MEAPEITKTERVDGDFNTYYIRLGRYDYVIASMSSRFGLVSLISSYGNYAYDGWGSRGDDTIEQFFMRANTGYLAEKFTYDRGGDRFSEEFDAEKTVENIINQLQTEIFPQGCDPEELAGLEEELKDLIDDCGSDSFGDLFFYRASDLHLGDSRLTLGNLFEDYDYGIYSTAETRPTTKYLSIKNILIPAVKEALKARGVE
jgi:hypothetical protein